MATTINTSLAVETRVPSFWEIDNTNLSILADLTELLTHTMNTGAMLHHSNVPP